jgi:hypothetical protein
VDADGYFYIKYSESIIKNRKKESISCRFQLEQRKSYSRDGKSYEDIMLKIATLFDVSLTTIKRKDSEIYCISVNSIKCLTKVINYFKIYPLMKCWLKAYNMIFEKSHLRDEGKEIIFNLRNSMNNKRTLFNWNYLNRYHL